LVANQKKIINQNITPKTDFNMDSYSTLKNEIVQINDDILSLFSMAKSMPGISDDGFEDWEKTCQSMQNQLREEIVRVAIVGAIKSGKSTFLNSIFKGDYVKRGAGVVTSIVTRVRSGDQLRANLFFKSWNEINADMQQALSLFSSLNWRSENKEFDITLEKERTELRQALTNLSADQLINHDTRNINNVLLSSYLKGYDVVEPILSPGNSNQVYGEEKFADHKSFVGKETLAVYLKDIQLEIPFDSMDRSVEIADCQGSDSSNPLHLALIQDYLQLTNLIVYVISSRTGLRQADIRFLSMIKKMGILDNILFVLNCDFSEHETIDDLNSLVAKVREELAMIKKDPKVFSFSALFNLFTELGGSLSKKDRLRFEQWMADPELVDFSNRETRNFQTLFTDVLARKRNSLLVNNHVERLGVILTGLVNWINASRDILDKDAGSAAEILKLTQHHQKRLDQIKSAIENSLTGAIPKVKKSLSAGVNKLFDPHSGDVIKKINNFIVSYNASPEGYEENLKVAGFSNTLFKVYQEFMQSLNTYITETINPEVFHFLSVRENKVKKNFESVIAPHDAMLQDAYQEYNKLLDGIGITADQTPRSKIKLPELEAICRMAGLQRPPLVISGRYSAKIKTEAIMRLGFYRALKNLKVLLRKKAKTQGLEAQKALKAGIVRMKRETLRSMIYHLKDYQENFKFKYLFKLVEAMASVLTQATLDRFQAYFTDLGTIAERINDNQVDKDKVAEILEEMERASLDVQKRIEQVRAEIK